uniref:Uncharacterized protein n=1 Tax=Parascaris univalens TaxID=6257 RepID=A0A915AC46_PARUN
VLFSLICTVATCGCGGCNYASDIACARCCTAYVKRATNFLTSALENWQDRTLPTGSNFQSDVLPIKYQPQPRFFVRNDLKSSLHLQTSTDDSRDVLQFISKASELRRFRSGKSADIERIIEIYNYLDSLRSSGEKGSAAKRNEPMTSHQERKANNMSREQSALHAIVWELYN